MSEFSNNVPCERCGLKDWVDVGGHSRTRGLCMSCRGIKPKGEAMADMVPIQKAELEQEGLEAIDTRDLFRGFEIASQADLEVAGKALIEVKARWGQLEEKKRAVVDPINKSLKELRSWFKPPQDYYAECEQILKGKIAAYHQDRGRDNQAAMNEAGEAHRAGDAAGVSEALAKIDLPEKTEGVSLRETWDFEVINADLVPREYLAVDLAAVRRAMQAEVAAGHEPVVPGVRFFKKTGVAVRTGT